MPLGITAAYNTPDEIPFARAFRTALVLGLPFLLEPILIRSFGCTIGQYLVRTRVVSSANRHLGIFRLTLRYWTKIFLGVLSVFYVRFSPQGQAIHDLWFGTNVVLLPTGFRGVPRAPSPAVGDPQLPSAFRRFIAFALWSFVSLCCIIAVLVVVFESIAGIPEDQTLVIYDTAGVVLWLLSVLWLAGLGARGRLFGARRRTPPEAAA